jgi:hypothetical protein
MEKQKQKPNKERLICKIKNLFRKKKKRKSKERDIQDFQREWSEWHPDFSAD